MMLVFSNSQFETMESVWQIDQLLGKIPEILLYLKEKHNSLYDELGEWKNRENARLRINDATKFGYTEVEQIQQQLDMQYQNRSILFNEKSLLSLYQAHNLTADDRNSAIAQLLLINRSGSKSHPYMKADILYQSGTNDILENYLHLETSADYPEESPYLNNIHLIRHSRIYRLLKQYLPNTESWISLKSDWKTSMISLESSAYHRRIELIPAPNKTIEFSLSEDELPTLKIQIPDNLNATDMTLMGKLISAWTLHLYPVKKMNQEFEAGENNA